MRFGVASTDGGQGGVGNGGRRAAAAAAHAEASAAVVNAHGVRSERTEGSGGPRRVSWWWSCSPANAARTYRRVLPKNHKDVGGESSKNKSGDVRRDRLRLRAILSTDIRA